ncbi:hypothetical protein CL653_02180 [bacterium]|nr:hypothetical protein [bacterium]
MMTPLSQKQRRWFFNALFIMFFCAVPVFIFYAAGYRLDIGKDETSIIGVGGIYLITDGNHIDMFLDNEPIEDMRVFRSAAYMQNVEAGLHNIYTNGVGVQTWSKRLPVWPHIVTRVESFNLPKVPQVRLIPTYKTSENADIVTDEFNDLFDFASTINTNTVTLASTTASSRLANPEYLYLSQRFASSTEERLQVREQVERFAERFTFESTSATTTLATTSKQYGDIYLREEDEEVYAGYLGQESKKPEYFCITYTTDVEVIRNYGEHVLDSLYKIYTDLDLLAEPTKLCRSEIKIDRLRQTVHYFDFVPGRENLVLLQLDDGLYVIEVDDRSWQNTQKLYGGVDIEVIVEGGNIYVHDRGYILEVMMELSQ